MKCFYWDRAKGEHERANKQATNKLYFVGKLTKVPICSHCIIRLGQLTAPAPTVGAINEIEALRERHPEYAQIVDELGLETVRFELACNIVEANPQEQKIINTNARTSLIGEDGGETGNKPQPPKKPQVIVD